MKSFLLAPLWALAESVTEPSHHLPLTSHWSDGFLHNYCEISYSAHSCTLTQQFINLFAQINVNRSRFRLTKEPDGLTKQEKNGAAVSFLPVRFGIINKYGYLLSEVRRSDAWAVSRSLLIQEDLCFSRSELNCGAIKYFVRAISVGMKQLIQSSFINSEM